MILPNLTFEKDGIDYRKKNIFTWNIINVETSAAYYIYLYQKCGSIVELENFRKCIYTNIMSPENRQAINEYIW